MFTAVKNQIHVSFLSVKYALMREMLNKTTFLMNVLFMVLNNAAFIIQWIILYSLKDQVGGYTLKQVLLLWGIAAGTYGFSRFFFHKTFNLSDVINTGKLDSFLIQPKNVLVSVITTEVSTSAIGDFIYGYIMLLCFGLTFSSFILFNLFIVCGGFILASVAVILGSLSFWFQKSDLVADTGNNLLTNFATYPDGIFKGAVKVLLYTVIPVGFVNYIPVQVLTKFDIWLTLLVVVITVLFITLAFLVFNRGLKRYSSSNLMIARL